VNRICLLFLILSLSLSGCLSQRNPPTPRPPSAAELCRLLGRDIKVDKQCKYASLSIFEEEFPPGVARIEDVRKVLGPYLVSSEERVPIGGTFDTYVILWGLLYPTMVSFTFDKEGLLLHIDIID
jgi:hypothetical protein